MCGIVGIIAADSRKYQTHIDSMVTSIAHRGPDGNGVYFFDNCALGHSRLSIVDLQTGHQPMISDKGIGITFNGEIYGFREIRDSLKNYHFRTLSDTEVIVALYETYGRKFIDHLQGMYAFAIWDSNRDLLISARDRFGEKPFYYALGRNGEFIFASEIKAIIATGLIDPVIDMQSVRHYMRYLYVPPSETIYNNIYTLPPAHSLYYDYRTRKLVVERYWDLPVGESDILLEEAIDIFKSLLGKAIEKQLVADVPVGVFLSGGLDSTTIAALASIYSPRIQTFSFGFENSISELPFARQVANKYQTEHVELVDGDVDIGALLMTMQDVYDEPFADSSNIPTYLISKLAKQHCKVILTGDGGDELFGGYDSWYKPLLYMEKNNNNIILSSFLRILLKSYRIMKLDYNPSWEYYVEGDIYRRRHKTIVNAHAAQHAYFSDEELNNFGLPQKNIKLYQDIKCNNTVDDAFRFDIGNYMAGDILVKIDRSSMANGLELRAPFLDVDFASFCIGLPQRLKITEKSSKIILREAYSDMWPEDIGKRSKQGFGGPVKKWLLLDTVRDLKEQYLNNRQRRIFSLLSFKETRDVVKADNYKTWILLVLSLWMDKNKFDVE